MAGIIPRIIFTILVLSVFYVQLGSALICWTCDPCPNPHSNTSSSVRAANCSTSNTICVKNTVRIVNRADQISKGCVSSCTQSSTNSFGTGPLVDCCNTDYCNSSTRNHLSLPFCILFIITFAFTFSYRQ